MTTRKKDIDLKSPGYVQMVLNRVMAEHLNQTIDAFDKVGINIQTCRVLVALHHHERLRAGILAYLVGLEQTAISHLLKSLSQRGLIVREREEADNRAVEVRLTAEGKRLAVYCHKAALKQERLLLTNLTRTEVEQLRKIVWKMDESIRGGAAGALRKTGDGNGKPRR